MKYYYENVKTELGAVRSDRHRGQAAGRSAGNDRGAAAGQHQDMGADGRQGGNGGEHRQLLQARQPDHEAVRPRQEQFPCSCFDSCYQLKHSFFRISL